MSRIAIALATAFVVAGSSANAEANVRDALRSSFAQLCNSPERQATQTCEAMRKELAALDGSIAQPSDASPERKVVLELSDELTRSDKKTGGMRHDQHVFRGRAGFAYAISWETADMMQMRICRVPKPITFNCHGRLDRSAVTRWELQGSNEDVFLLISGFKGAGKYRLRVEEWPLTDKQLDDWRTRQSGLRAALAGQTFMEPRGDMIVRFVDTGGNFSAQVLDVRGEPIRIVSLGAFKSGEYKGQYYFKGSGDPGTVAALVSSHGISTLGDYLRDENYNVDSDGNLRLAFFNGNEYSSWTLLRLPADRAQRAWETYQANLRAGRQPSGGGLGELLSFALSAAAIEASGGNSRDLSLTGPTPTLSETLDAVNSNLERRNAEQRAQLEARIAADRSQREAFPMTPLPPPQAGMAVGGGSGSPQANGRLVPIRFYYTVGLVPDANNTRNPMCYSNVVTLSEQVDVSGFGAPGRAMPFVEPYRALFLEKCARLGRLSGTAAAMIDQVTSGWPYPTWHSEDRQVTLP